MDSYDIWGGARLFGQVEVSGAKNAVLPILAATVMIPGETVLERCPRLADVHNMCEILQCLGCDVWREGDSLRIDSSHIKSCRIPPKLMKRLRSSVFLAGPLLARYHQAVLSAPGGCAIGKRPTDLHFSGLRALGAEVKEEKGQINCLGTELQGARIRLSYPSVGATENIMMAASMALGETILSNAAREPEIIDLQDFLNACGAEICGAGTSEIHIRGVKSLHPARYCIMGDRIEGGTYLMAAAITGGEVTVKGLEPSWLSSELSVLKTMGCRIKTGGKGDGADCFIRLSAPERLCSPGWVKAEPWPGFSTDLQSPLLALCTVAEGRTVIEDTVFESRFQCAGELNALGADIRVKGQRALVTGRKSLKGGRVFASDLRGGAALVIAALGIHEKTVIENICHIDRGYGKFDIALNALGANIERRVKDERKTNRKTSGVSEE